jgi:hypothetical protein
MKRLSALVLGLALCTVASAQGVTIVAPVDRFVAPGERVELVFELSSSDPAQLEASAFSDLGWLVSVDPDRITLDAATTASVTVTAEVPIDAAAFSVERVTLSLFDGDAVTERIVELEVVEFIDVRLEAPTQANLGTDALRVTVTNDGNSLRSLSVELLRADDDAVLARAGVSLTPGAAEVVAFDLEDEGAFVVRVTSARGVEAERSVQAVRFGTPEPAPFGLSGFVSAGFDIDDGWGATVGLRGPLSDFSRVDARFDAPNWRSSFAAVTLERGTVRVGAGSSAPFGLDLPREFGVLATYDHDGVGVGGMIGITANEELAAYAAASYATGGASVAAGAGVRAGDPVASLTSSYRASDWGIGLNARYRQERLDARLTGDVRIEGTTTNLRAELRDGFTTRARADVEARFRTGPTTVSGLVTAPIGPTAAWDWRAGLTHTFDVELPGTLTGALQAGARESFARVTYRTSIGPEWQSTNTAGVRYDTTGFGVTLDSLWAWRGDQTFSFDTRLTYYPALPRITGVTRVRIGLVEEPVSLNLNAAWNIGNRTLGVDADLSIGEGDWDLDLAGGVRYAYARPSNPWAFEASVTLTYRFDVPVSDGVTEAMGGRRLGTLIGVVTVDGRPLSDVVVSAGRFRAITDADGRFELTMPPASYRVTLDGTTLPSGVTFADGTTATIEVVLRETSEVVFEGLR